ncbi:paraneoplastic antigen-like protein 8A [Phacochoerus africanus]|uniref:paraneoplastic antigen-like protein 8A n=1 Tax=Phacochoerus africanus TaxID=41426 RepID=UPI001FD94FE4|nr:paraneoplastic antigen-like protein 8A [Phacochoerus africanus]
MNEFLDAEGQHLGGCGPPAAAQRAPTTPQPESAPGELGRSLGAASRGGGASYLLHGCRAECSREEARAQELAEAQAVASLVSAAGRKVKKEPGWKMEKVDDWNDVEAEGDPPKSGVRKAGAKIRSRRTKQKKTPKRESLPWKKSKGSHSRGSASLEAPEAGDAENTEGSEYVGGSKKPCVKQESALKKPVVKCAWKFPSSAPDDAGAGAGSPGVASESDQDGGPEGPPKKKAMGWALAKSPAPKRKKKKVSLGPVSYVLVDSEDTKKKPVVPKKGPGLGRDVMVQKAPQGPQPAESQASNSQGPKAKPRGSPRASDEPRKL